tara:strand:+ start:228115 stop:228987 length:873 start_codon:yes stop_codon:yes gene_type:complete
MIETGEISKIAIITPVKDEIENLDRFFNHISQLSIPIYTLVIVENDSVDGTKEYLKKKKNPENINNFEVLNINFEDKSYDLEFKYAEIIDKGLHYLRKQNYYHELKYVGILDSDVFPEPNYYSKLINFLTNNPKVGITSGIIYTLQGKKHVVAKNWVRGGCRLWKKECLDQTGFPIAPSPDAISVALAEISGWRALTVNDAKVYSREVGERMKNFKTFGSRVYYRGSTPFFAILKSFYHIFIEFRIKVGVDFLRGYFNDFFSNKPRIENIKVKEYYRKYLYKKIKDIFIH